MKGAGILWRHDGDSFATNTKWRVDAWLTNDGPSTENRGQSHCGVAYVRDPKYRVAESSHMQMIFTSSYQEKVE